MRKILAFLLLCSFSLSAQFGLSEDYQLNPLAINPAFAGVRGNFGVTAILGNQFVGGFRPRQVSQIVSLDGKVGEGNSSIGFQGYRNALGTVTNNGLNLSYSYSLRLTEAQINFGINGGFGVTPALIGSTNFLDQLSPYAGLGIVAINKNGFVSISTPVLLAQDSPFVPNKKPLNIMLGYRFEIQESIAFNISALAGFEKTFGNFYHLNPKLWLNDKVGLSASIRLKQTGTSKIIPMLQYRVSEGSSVALGYDPQPFSEISVNPSLVPQSGIIQLIYKYDVFNFNDDTPSLNLF